MPKSATMFSLSTHEDVTTKRDIYEFLRHAGDAPVQLLLNSSRRQPLSPQ